MLEVSFFGSLDIEKRLRNMRNHAGLWLMAFAVKEKKMAICDRDKNVFSWLLSPIKCNSKVGILANVASCLYVMDDLLVWHFLSN